MKKSHINNHYIQKAFAQSWSDEHGKINYIFDGELERKTFNINDLNKNQPISKKYFYSKEIERAMNEIESDGIKVIKKIIKSNKNIELFWHEIISLKFYLYLSGIRTCKFRDNIKNLTGDSLFNKIIREQTMDAFNIQEKYIKDTIKYYKEFKNDNLDEYLKITQREHEKILNFIKENLDNLNHDDVKEFEWNNASLESSIYHNLYNILHCSKLIFVKFNSNSLVLSDANSYCEYYNDKGPFYNQKIYEFFPLSPSIGVIIYNNELSIINKSESKIFKNSLHDKHSKNEYINNKQIIKELAEINDKNTNDIDAIDVESAKQILLLKIEQVIIYKHKHKFDKYIYDFIEEDRDVAIMCNAMMLVHNFKNIIIYKNYSDVIEAKKLISCGFVYRKENVT